MCIYTDIQAHTHTYEGVQAHKWIGERNYAHMFCTHTSLFFIFTLCVCASVAFSFCRSLSLSRSLFLFLSLALLFLLDTHAYTHRDNLFLRQALFLTHSLFCPQHTTCIVPHIPEKTEWNWSPGADVSTYHRVTCWTKRNVALSTITHDLVAVPLFAYDARQSHFHTWALSWCQWVLSSKLETAAQKFARTVELVKNCSRNSSKRKDQHVWRHPALFLSRSPQPWIGQSDHWQEKLSGYAMRFDATKISGITCKHAHKLNWLVVKAQAAYPYGLRKDTSYDDEASFIAYPVGNGIAPLPTSLRFSLRC